MIVSSEGNEDNSVLILFYSRSFLIIYFGDVEVFGENPF